MAFRPRQQIEIDVDEEALRSAGEETTTETRARSPIGVPADYRPNVVRSYSTGGFHGGVQGARPRPIYYSEDLVRPGTQWTTNQRLNWQIALADAGLLTSEDWAPGVWNATTQSAYREVLAYANQNGLTKEEALAELAANPTIKQLQARARAGGGGGGGRSVTLANPQDLVAVAKEVAQQVIGRRLTPEQEQAFVQSFHAAQRSGGNPPSMDVAAEAFAREADPTAAAAGDTLPYFEKLMSMMAGGA